MTFTRTPAGLSNQYLFWRVDALVFVEGGQHTYSLSQVEAGSFGSQSIDILFWQSLFRCFLPNRKFQFRAVGSKATLTQIARYIESGTVSHVFAAMDRNHDRINNRLIQAPGVFYTYGYSWENDILHAGLVTQLFVSMCSVSLNGVHFRTEIDSFYHSFARDMRWPVYADALLSRFDATLLPRDSPEMIITLDSRAKPSIDRNRISALIQHAQKVKAQRGSTYLLTPRFTCCPHGDCFGRLVSAYFYRVLTYMLKTHSNVPSLPKYYAWSMAINTFIHQLHSQPAGPHFQHYSTLFSALP